MSATVQQIYTSNPSTVIANTDLIYIVKSPYTPGTDSAILGSNLKAMFAPVAGSSSITTVGTITSGTWNGSIIAPAFGGTGINNGTSTITIGGNFSMLGAFTFSGTLTGNTAVTFPTSGTLATVSQIPTGQAGSKNVTDNAQPLVASVSGAFTLNHMVVAADTLGTIKDSGVTLIGQTGTGTFVGSVSPTITSPVIDQITNAGGNTIAAFSGPGTPVNYLQLVSGITSSGPELQAQGADAAINMYYRAKTSGVHLFLTTSALPQIWLSGTGYQHTTNWIVPNTPATRNITVPDADGTLALTSQLFTSPLTTKGDLLSFSTVNDRLPVAVGNGKILQVDSATATGLNYSTATYPVTAGTSGNVLKSDGTNFVSSPSTTVSVNKQVLISGTTYTPTAGTFYAEFELVGGGASGGGTGATAAGQAVASAGGGGGGYFLLSVTAAQIALGVTYTIGAGGAAPAAGAFGNNGTATTLTIGGGTAWQAQGGVGGNNSLGAAAPTQVPGGNGGGVVAGTNATALISSPGCPGFSGVALSASNYNVGGNGGGGIYGQGGGKGAGSGPAASIGTAGTARGAGGGGSASTQSGAALTAGAGLAGVIVVTEYIST